VTQADQRLLKLEERMAYLEHSLEALSLTVVELDKARRSLAGECDRLRKRLAELSDSAAATIHDPPPPHY
jgi:uncharacterized coiled-coil protein SlyX